MQNIESMFYALAEEWKRERRSSSRVSCMTCHESYAKIIQLGETVVPYLLREFRNSPDHWDAALTEILGVDPVEEESYGNLDAICQDWWNYGKKMGYV